MTPYDPDPPTVPEDEPRTQAAHASVSLILAITASSVANSLSRRAVLIDLNADYLIQAMGRNRDIPLGLVG